MCSAPLTVRPEPPEIDTRCEAAGAAAAAAADWREEWEQEEEEEEDRWEPG